MAAQGTFDPDTYVPGDAGTYPQPAAGDLYQPGMWWEIDPAGTFDGQPVAPGDRIYVRGAGRLYGQGLYGDATYGGEPGSDWLAANVSFFVWVSTLPPAFTDPLPYTGCPFDETRHPGWRIVIDALYNADDGSRTYGTDTYGDSIYGDPAGRGVVAWHDLTDANYDVVVARGTPAGHYVVDVDRMTFDLVDDDGAVFDFAQPASWYRPQPGDQIRVGLFDPAWQYHPLAVGEIRRVHDVHDAPPRLLTVDAYGFQTDLVNTVRKWRRVAEPIQTRTIALLTAAGWRWNPAPEFPQPIGPELVGDPEPVDVIARDELDRVAISAGWTADTNRRGALRLREWPLQPVGDPVDVADCVEPPVPDTALTAAAMDIYADYDDMLNVADMSNVWGSHVESVDWQSVGRHGRQTENFGFPLSDLATFAVDMQSLADRYVDELGAVVVHVSGVEADTFFDPGWLAVLADLDTGTPVTVHRVALPTVLAVDAVVVGYELRLQPGRARASIYTRTTTPTTRKAL